MDWISVKQLPPPFSKDLILSNGVDRLLGSIEKHIRDDGSEYITLNVEGVSGWDWEPRFEYHEIKFWLPAPRLPQ